MSAFSDDDAAELKASLQRARRQPMNFAAALGKRPEDHRLSLHHTRAGRALAKVLKEATGSKQLAFGITEVDDSRKDTLVLVLDAKPPTGLAKKLANWLKLHGLPIRKVALKLEGQELEDDGDEQESEDASPNTPAPGKLTTLEAAFRQLVLKVKTLVEQAPQLDAALLPAVKAIQRALSQGDEAAATEGIRRLAQAIAEAQAGLAAADAKYKQAIADLEKPLRESMERLRNLQSDPKVKEDRKRLEKTSARLSQAIKKARQAAKAGDAKAQQALEKLLAEERKAAREVLAPYWPGGKDNPGGDWAMLVARLDVSSPKDGAVFWSGDKNNAIDLAMGRGGISLESTGGGAMIDDWNATGLPWNGGKGDPPPYLMDLWQLASAAYASQAEGVITAIQTPEKKLTDGGDMWRHVERKILRRKELQGLVTLTEPIIQPSSLKKA